MQTEVNLQRLKVELTEYQEKGVTLIENVIQYAIYLNQVIEAMRPYFNSQYGPYDNYYHFPPQYGPAFPSLTPFVYVFYNSPLLQAEFPSKQMQIGSNFSHSFCSNALGSTSKSSSDEASLHSLKSLSQEVTKREQKSKQELPEINLEKTDIDLPKISPPIQNSPPKPQENRFVKKNTQSNIVSQIFSFLWSPEKNHEYLPKVLETKEKIKAFQAIMRTVKVKCKTQVNRVFLKRFLRSKEWPASFKKLLSKVRGQQCLRIEELQVCIRKLSFLYLRQLHRCSIMTSKKMNKRLWDTHFKKCQQIKKFLFEEEE